MNKVIMIGHITKKIELRYLQSNIAIGNTAIVVNKNYKKTDGSKAQITCFIDIIFYGRLAEIANEYLQKGSKVSIEGRLNMTQWSDQQGNSRVKHNIIVESLEMLDSKNKVNKNNDTQNNNSTSSANVNTKLQTAYINAPSVSLEETLNNNYLNNNRNDTDLFNTNNEIPF